MSNNIYNILSSFGKVAQEAQPLAESKQEKKSTLLESTMEGILAERFAEFKEAEKEPTHGKSAKECGGADAYYHRPCNPSKYGFEKGSAEHAEYMSGFKASDEGPKGGKNYLESEEQMMEKSPPGMEDLVMKLKKQYPGKEGLAYATAWSVYNKKHGKSESMEEAKEKKMNAFHPDFAKKEKEKEGTGKFDKFDTGYSKRYTKKDAKPDYIDLDNDGDTDEPMKKAAKDKKAGEKRGRGRPRKNESLLDSLMYEYDSALAFNESDDLEQDQLRQHIGDDLYGKAVAFVKGGADSFNFPEDLYDALLNYYMENGEMPYGTAKARDGDPYEWLANKLEQVLGNADLDDNRPEVDDADQQPNGDADQEPIPQESIEMNESVKDIAKLAGIKLMEAVGDIPPTQRAPLTPKTAGTSDAKSTYKVKTPQGYKYYDDATTADKDAQLYKSTVEFNEAEVEEGNEFSGALAKAKAAGAKEFEVDGKKYQVESLSECGMMPEQSEKKDAFTVTATYNGAEGTQTINVNADGETANQIAQILKLSGLMGGKQEQVYSEPKVEIVSDKPIVQDAHEMEIEEDERYQASTTPDEHTMPVSALTKGGDGEVAGMEKPMHKHGYKHGDNPLAMEETDPIARLGRDLMAEYESIKLSK